MMWFWLSLQTLSLFIDKLQQLALFLQRLPQSWPHVTVPKRKRQNFKIQIFTHILIQQPASQLGVFHFQTLVSNFSSAEEVLQTYMLGDVFHKFSEQVFKFAYIFLLSLMKELIWYSPLSFSFIKALFALRINYVCMLKILGLK